MKRILLSIAILYWSFGGYAQLNDEQLRYESAFAELKQMVDDEIPISFKRAVFLTEYAFDNQLSYDSYLTDLEILRSMAGVVYRNDELDYRHKDIDDIRKAAAIYKVLKQPLVFGDSSGVQLAKEPFTYDMEDFWGEEDWSKMFVTKLLQTNTGNCHSLPALYRILADEMGIKVWLAMAPNHTYIKHWSDKTGWYNIELTTGSFPYDKDIKWNSYIKTEAVANGVYMDTLSAKENIAYIITDLAQGYTRKFGNGDVAAPIRWLETALRYYPDYINALILKAELQKKQYEQAMTDLEVVHFKELWGDHTMKKSFEEIEKIYFSIHQLGYRKMPKEMYLNWLFRVSNDTTKAPFKFDSPQPFKKYGYDVFMMTAGDGQNYEFYDQDSLAQIGTIKINRLTGKIASFDIKQVNDFRDEVISRMYDPAIGRFYQVDPMSLEYHDLSPYAYVANNPIRNIDPDGRNIYDMTTDKAHKSALARFAQTKQGQRFLAQYAKAGDVVGGVKFTQDGKYAHQHVAFYSTRMNANGRTRSFLRTRDSPTGLELGAVTQKTVGNNLDGLNNLSFAIDLNSGISEDQALETIGHESFIHVEKTTKDVEKGLAGISNGEFGSGEKMLENFANFMSGLSSDKDNDHKLAIDGKVATMEEFINALDQLTGGTKFRDMYESWKKEERKRQ